MTREHVFMKIEPGAYCVVHHVHNDGGELVGLIFEGVLGFLMPPEATDPIIPVTTRGPCLGAVISGPHDEIICEGEVFYNHDAYFEYAKKAMN